MLPWASQTNRGQKMTDTEDQGRLLTAKEIAGKRKLLTMAANGRPKLESRMAAAEGSSLPGRHLVLSALKDQHEMYLVREMWLTEDIQTGREKPRPEIPEDPSKKVVSLPWLGVCVHGGNVFMLLETLWLGPYLGPLAGARAEVVAATVGNRRAGRQRTADATLAAVALGSPIGLLAGAYSRPKKGGIAVVRSPDGKTRQTTLPDPASLASAQAQAARFNTLAAAAAQPAVNGNGDAGIAGQLERLAALHASGALNDEEYQAAKARLWP